MKVDMYIELLPMRKGRPNIAGTAKVKLVYVDRAGATHIREFSVYDEGTESAVTLCAMVAGFRRLIRPCEVAVHTENEFVRNAISKRWLNAWERRGFKKAGGGELKNEKEWRQVAMASRIHRVSVEEQPARLKRMPGQWGMSGCMERRAAAGYEYC